MNSWNNRPLPTVPDSDKGQIIDLEGRQTHFTKTGSGEALILIHGYFYDHHMWDLNIEALSEKFTVYALDLWGAGLSCRGKLAFSYDLFVEQIRLFMDYVGIDKAAFCGQGMGGGTIMHLASQYPDKVNKMILIDSAGLPDKVPLTARLMRFSLIALPLFKLPGLMIRRHILHSHFMKSIKKFDVEIVSHIVAFHKIKGTSKCLLDMLQAKFFHSLEKSIEVISQSQIPTLITWGKDDCSNPLRQGQKLHKTLQGSQLLILSDAGHVSNADQPEEFNKRALEFLSNTESK